MISQHQPLLLFPEANGRNKKKMKKKNQSDVHQPNESDSWRFLDSFRDFISLLATLSPHRLLFQPLLSLTHDL